MATATLAARGHSLGGGRRHFGRRPVSEIGLNRRHRGTVYHRPGPSSLMTRPARPPRRNQSPPRTSRSCRSASTVRGPKAHRRGATASLFPRGNLLTRKRRSNNSQVRDNHAQRSQAVAQRYRDKLVEWYGKDKGDKVRHAEAFEVCEYGRRPDKRELTQLFPFFGE